MEVMSIGFDWSLSYSDAETSSFAVAVNHLLITYCLYKTYMKGKERKGKERKGKERKEKTGKESKGKEKKRKKRKYIYKNDIVSAIKR